MKKIIKPAVPEQSENYCDFTGENLNNWIPAEVKISCGYGSQYDGFSLNLDLSDPALEELLEFIKGKLSPQTKENLKEIARDTDVYLCMASDSRDWESFNRYGNDKEMMEYLAEQNKPPQDKKLMLFSERLKISEDVQKYCEDNGVLLTPLGIVTTLCNMGVLK